MGVVVLKVEAGRLREPAALLMLAVAITNVLTGLMRLLFPVGTGVSANSFGLRSATALKTFASPTFLALVVIAVLLVIKFGERTPRAQLVGRIAAGTLGVCLLFSLVTVLGVLFGDVLTFRDKFESLIVGLPTAGLVFLGLAFVTNSAAGFPAAARPAKTGGEGLYDAQREGNGYPQDPYAAQGYAQGYAQAPQGQPAADVASPYAQLPAPVDQQYAQDPYASLYAPDRSQEGYGAPAAQGDGYAAQTPYPQATSPAPDAQPQPQDFQTGAHYSDQYGSAGYQQAPGGQAYGSNQGFGAEAPAAASYGQQPDSTTPGQTYEGYPQSPAYDQYGYASQQQPQSQPQQPQAGGYAQAQQPFGGQQESGGFQQSHGTEGRGFAQGPYQDSSFGQSGSHAAPAPAGSSGSHAAGDARPYEQGDPSQQYGQQGGSPFSGYSGAQFPPAGDAPAQGGFDGGPQPAYDQPAPGDPREQQLAQAYQQAQSYQQLGTPTDYPPTPAAPPAADYFGNPLGHPQQPGPYSTPGGAPSDQQTTRLDPPAYQGDALSGPSRREEPLDPTAIYAPERSQAKYEEGSGTDQAGHGTDTSPHWYGSER
ncbi:hypothetical protein Pmi06nite_66120 [Planotetraspora mira]|uniref:Uncharacterized protein n=1 Tax=Planotetraspora mira TaxID=58121 RepID=A0A8J3X9S3_9ACTN|nr:hypothetical protein Pmi06nite_66120 [Planotetraspora mira]